MLAAMRPPAPPAAWSALLLAALCLPGAAAARDAGGHLRLYVQPVETMFLADAATRQARLRARLAAAEAEGDERAAEFLRGLLAQSGEAPSPPAMAPPAEE